MRKNQTPKSKFFSGVLQFAWAEIKTMNMIKIKSLYKIAVGYFLMKRNEKRRMETSYKLTH